MGLWSGLTGAVGKIFGTEKAVNRVFDVVERGVDKAIFTKEEKRDYHLLFLKAYEPFKVAQRLLAIMFSSAFIFWGSVGMVFYLFDPIKGKTIIQMTIDLFGVPTGVIVGFYFAGGAFEGAIRAGVEKREQSS